MNIGQKEGTDVEVWSPGLGWKPLSKWIFLTPKGLQTIRETGWSVRYSFRWRRTNKEGQ